MSMFLQDLAPAILALGAAALLLFLLWLAVRQAHHGSGKSKRRRPDPTAAE